MQKIKIAITGGIGSGKSTVCKILKELKYPVFSCDEIYREIQTEKEYIEQIRSAFPSAVRDHGIDKKILSSIVFSDAASLNQLNEISHPLIMKKLHEQMDKSLEKFVFAEVPLLFEGGYQKQFDKIVVVTRSKEERISAVQKRDGLTENEIQNRIKNQIDYSDLKQVASGEDLLRTVILKNAGSIKDLQNEVQGLIDQMSK